MVRSVGCTTRRWGRSASPPGIPGGDHYLVHPLRREGGGCKRRGRPRVRAQALEDYAEVAAPQLGLHVLSGVDHQAEHQLQDGDVFVGVGAAFAAIPNLIVGAVDEHETGEATGVNTVMRNIGSAVGAQVAGTIIATHVLANGLPENAAFTIALLVSAIGAVIAGLSVLLIPGSRSQQPAAEQREQAPVAARASA